MNEQMTPAQRLKYFTDLHDDAVSLRANQGWKTLQSQLKSEVEALFQRATNAETPHQMAKLMGMMQATKSVLDWPERQIEFSKSCLKQIADEREFGLDPRR